MQKENRDISGRKVMEGFEGQAKEFVTRVMDMKEV